MIQRFGIHCVGSKVVLHRGVTVRFAFQQNGCQQFLVLSNMNNELGVSGWGPQAEGTWTDQEDCEIVQLITEENLKERWRE